jgi:hypothetical protein
MRSTTESPLAPAFILALCTLAVPTPHFMDCFAPNIFPTDAPVPAPKFPSRGASDVAVAAAS